MRLLRAPHTNISKTRPRIRITISGFELLPRQQIKFQPRNRKLRASQKLDTLLLGFWLRNLNKLNLLGLSRIRDPLDYKVSALCSQAAESGPASKLVQDFLTAPQTRFG